MIEGLKFQMQPDELRGHLAERIAHHSERAAWYRDKARELVDGGIVAAQMTGGDPVQAMGAKQKEHENLVRLFDWMQKHVVDEPYQLDDKDLQRLEILSSRW